MATDGAGVGSPAWEYRVGKIIDVYGHLQRWAESQSLQIKWIDNAWLEVTVTADQLKDFILETGGPAPTLTDDSYTLLVEEF